MKHISKVRASIALSTCLASIYGCSSTPESASAEEEVGTTASALTGSITFAPSCMTEPSPQTTPPAVPSDIRRHLKISEAYTRIVASSPAFRACMTSVMARSTTLGVPGTDSSHLSGPYFPCTGDPGPPTTAAVVSNLLSANGTIINCDYSAIGTNRGGSAFIGDIDSSGREVLSFGNALGLLNQPENCAYNPDGRPCVSDAAYMSAAGTLGHEIMHTHGFTHVGDAVWNLNNVNVGDVVGSGATAYTLTLADFCGVTPSPTPSTGTAPTAPTSTPTPGVHPTYGTGIPYEVGSCIDTVLRWSEASGHLHDDCGPDFPGLNLVDSVLTGTPATATSHCVRDPYTGGPYASRGGVPIPPHAPTTCRVYPGCRTTSDVSVICDDNANPVHLEQRVAGTTRPWRRTGSYSYSRGNEYRACAESLYGRACSTVTVAPQLCIPDPPRFEPIPWWKWVPFTGRLARASKVAARLGGGHVMAAPVPAGLEFKYPQLGSASGDLSPSFGALGIGVYNAQVGRFLSLGPSTGNLPPVRGTAFATVMGVDGQAHLLGFGGETPNATPIATLYDGAISADDKGMQTSWTSSKLGPGARAYASATANLDGDTAYLFGGRGAKGVTGELWSYAVASGEWKLVSAQAASARTGAAMTIADDGTIVLFGGRDAYGKGLGDLVLIDPKSGESKVVATSLVPRDNAAVVVQGGQVFVYGGQSASGANELLDVVSLADGKTLSQTKVGVAASFGSSIDVDEDGIVTIVPGAVPGASVAGGAFVGIPGKLTFVPE